MSWITKPPTQVEGFYPAYFETRGQERTKVIPVIILVRVVRAFPNMENTITVYHILGHPELPEYLDADDFNWWHEPITFPALPETGSDT